MDSDGVRDKASDLRQEANKISENEQKSKDNSINYGLSDNNINALTDCNFWKYKKFDKVDPYSVKTSAREVAGSLVLKGHIVQRVEDASFSDNGEKVTKVYLVFDNPVSDEQKIYYDHYLALTKINGINSIDGQKLLFRLGIIKDSKLTTSADISEELKNRIVSSIDKDNLVQLKLVIPIYPGGGVGDNFSFACDISE